MSKEIVEKKEQALSTDVTQWGTDVSVGKDLLISKVLTMQAMSDMVTGGDAKIGEFRDSITQELLGDITKPLSFIPFHARKLWDILESADGSQPEWVRTVDLVEDPTRADYNDNWEWSVDLGDGKLQKRVRRLDFFCLLADQVDKGTAMPVTISFRSTSYRSGQVLLNQMYVRNKMMKKSPAAVVMNLAGEKVKNDKGTFVVTTVTPAKEATVAQQNAAFEWYKIINSSNVVVDESDSKQAEVKHAEAPTDKSAGRF